MDLEKDKSRKQLIMQNALLSKARKRRAIKEAETIQKEQSPSNSSKNDPTNSKDDDICVIYHKKEVKKDEDIVFIEENKINRNDKDRILREMATQALIREANLSAQRAKEYGPQGWIKPRALTTNKRFLARTLQSVKLDHKEHEQRKKTIKEKWRKSEGYY
ncbi:hypothetical protein Mgra_00004834 [Meloidogyne graminicola]|uniref:Uncharacterized protein n=1 Tax=Meloidogyne graminicola TaxID=189291 RepID=A0A8S9ZR79_9BILA|nr:hypothetical protein Mgra_00004834 [Meloidogyne graminicola]